MDDVVKVLLVEDDDADALLVQRELASWPRHRFVVDRARNLAQMAQLWSESHAVVVLDLGLPDSRGMETLHEALVRCHDRPVVVFSGSDDGSDGLEAMRHGAEDFVPKGRRDRVARAIAYALERHRLTHAARAAAVIDELTGLPNRALFHDRLERAIRRAERHEHGVAVLFLDLDGFKPINDRYGHAIGDLVLKKVADRLQRGLRSADTVARLGGDEFAIVLEEVGSELAALSVATKIRADILRDISLRNRRNDNRFLLRTDVSIGVALFPLHANDAAALVRCADLAMYEAKSSPDSPVIVYQSTIDAALVPRLPSGAVSADQTLPPPGAFEVRDGDTP